MKARIIILLLMVISLAACSTENKVKSEFKNWVETEFPDPNILKEIVKVEPWDTITAQEYKEELLRIATRGKKMVDEFYDIMIWAKKSYYYHNESFNDKLLKAGRIFESEFDNFNLLSKTIERIGDMDIVQHWYRIKVRELQDGEIKFQYYFGYEIDGDFDFWKAGDERSTIMLRKIYDGDEETVFLVSEMIEAELNFWAVVDDLMKEKDYYLSK